jgi:hypothetical protein
LIPLTNGSIQLTSPADGVQFNLCGCGTIQQTSWTRAGDHVAWLGRDLNGDGLINNGKELFGDASEQGPPLYDDEPANGYRALRLLDNNSDGKITSADSEFAQLKLWVDLNHNGFSESSELLTPAQAGLTEISTDYKPVGKKDQHGNEFKFRSDVMVNGHKRRIAASERNSQYPVPTMRRLKAGLEVSSRRSLLVPTLISGVDSSEIP